MKKGSTGHSIGSRKEDAFREADLIVPLEIESKKRHWQDSPSLPIKALIKASWKR
jgi:hypothetical protein